MQRVGAKPGYDGCEVSLENQLYFVKLFGTFSQSTSKPILKRLLQPLNLNVSKDNAN